MYANLISQLKEDIRTDVVLIGANANSALSSYIFAKEGIDVVIIEPNPFEQVKTPQYYEFDYELCTRKSIFDFQKSLDCLYTLEAIITDLDNTCGYERRPSLQYTSIKEQLVDGNHMYYQLSSGLYYQCGARVNLNSLRYELLRSGYKRGVKVFGQATPTEYIISDESVEVIINHIYKIRANKVIIIDEDYQMFLKEKRCLGAFKNDENRLYKYQLSNGHITIIFPSLNHNVEESSLIFDEDLECPHILFNSDKSLLNGINRSLLFLRQYKKEQSLINANHHV